MSPNFTSNVDGELRVGAVQETITVTGESPIVDIQSSAQTRTMTNQGASKNFPGRFVDPDGRARARRVAA